MSRARSDDEAILLRIARRSDKAIGPSRRQVQGRWGLWTISALVVVEDGKASSSSSCLDLASQAPSANVAVFTFQCTKGHCSLSGDSRVIFYPMKFLVSPAPSDAGPVRERNFSRG